MSSRPTRWGFAALVAAALLPSGARAETIDLVNNTSGIAPGALFYQTQQQPTGTGVIDPFVRIQRTGTEQGYNTDVAKQSDFQFDEKFGIWTHSLPLNTLQSVTMGGKTYYQFLLDVNETATDTGRLLSLNEVQIYLAATGNRTDFTDGKGFGANGNKSDLVFDLDSGNVDRTVELDYKLNSGSGSGDMYMYIEKSLFDAAYAKNGYGYVYLYSAFGDPNGSDAGFEEWATLKKDTTKPPTNGVPAPPGLVLASMGFGCVLLGRLRIRRSAPKA